MWEMPWWVALIVAWGAGGVGFLLAAILSLGKLADEATERMPEVDVNGGRGFAQEWRFAQNGRKLYKKPTAVVATYNSQPIGREGEPHTRAVG